MDTYSQKLSHIYELVRLSKADKSLKEIERAFIRKVADNLGVDLNDLKSYRPSEHRLDLPNSESKIIPLFHRMVILMTLNMDSATEGKRICFDLGIKMGLHPQAILEIISIAEDEGVWDLQPQRITEIFNRYSN